MIKNITLRANAKIPRIMHCTNKRSLISVSLRYVSNPLLQRDHFEYVLEILKTKYCCFDSLGPCLDYTWAGFVKKIAYPHDHDELEKNGNVTYTAWEMPPNLDKRHKSCSSDEPSILQKFVSTPLGLETVDVLANMISCNILMT